MPNQSRCRISFRKNHQKNLQIFDISHYGSMGLVYFPTFKVTNLKCREICHTWILYTYTLINLSWHPVCFPKSKNLRAGFDLSLGISKIFTSIVGVQLMLMISSLWFQPSFSWNMFVHLLLKTDSNVSTWPQIDEQKQADMFLFCCFVWGKILRVWPPSQDASHHQDYIFFGGDTHKPSCPTVTGRGPHLKNTCLFKKTWQLW